MKIKYIMYKVQDYIVLYNTWSRRGRDRMVVRFTTTYAISAYHH